MRLFLLYAAVASLGALIPTEGWAQRNRVSERDDRSRQRGEARVDTTFAFTRGGIVELTQTSGDIVVTAWDRDEARVQASSERGRLDMHVTPARIAIGVNTVNGRRGDTRYEISVPVGVRVIARTSSGDIAVRGTRGPIEARTTNGDIEIADAADRIILEAVSGDVRASRLTGSVRVESVNGGIELRDVRGDVRAETTSGDVLVTGVESRNVYVATMGGEVEYDGAIDAAGRYEFHTHSGDLLLRVPGDARAQFHVETYSGTLDSEFSLTLQPGQQATGRPRRFEFALGGGGGARVTAETFSGDITLTRGSASNR